jgi:hypothetical protein
VAQTVRESSQRPHRLRSLVTLGASSSSSRRRRFFAALLAGESGVVPDATRGACRGAIIPLAAQSLRRRAVVDLLSARRLGEKQPAFRRRRRF